MNETIDVIKNHSTIRKFNNEKITEQEEREIIQSSLRGASVGNMMMYSIIKIRDKDLLKKLSVLCDNQSFVADSDLGLIFLIDTLKYETYFKQRGMEQRGYKGATNAEFILGAQDCMIAAQNAVIASESMGIGTCYIGDIVENEKDIKQLLNLPKGVMPLSFVVFGKYDVKPKLRDRFDEQFVVFKNEYPALDEDFINKMFEKKEMVDSEFGEKLFSRKMGSPFFKNMIESVNEYMKDWL